MVNSQWTSLVQKYLHDRTQRIKVNIMISDMETVQYGVPQGSTLGALLFFMYTNDITKSELLAMLGKVRLCLSTHMKGRYWTSRTFIGNTKPGNVQVYKYIGVHIDLDLNFKSHIIQIIGNCSHKSHLLGKIKSRITLKQQLIFIKRWSSNC